MVDNDAGLRRARAQRKRRAALLGAASAFLLGAAPEQEAVWILEIHGVINPLSAEYLLRGLEAATRAHATAVVVELDTPGGTMDATREMTQALLGSSVPVVVYVAPAGARAASAGMFITAAAHVAAMAPGTNIGAAHPVSIGGAEEGAGAEKAVNDAAAMVRAIAEERGRNADWLERAVRESVAVTAGEARALRVIDSRGRESRRAAARHRRKARADRRG